MNEKPTRQGLSRRQLLKLGGRGAAVLAAGALVPAAPDGFSTRPGRAPLYVFGFLDVTPNFADPPSALDVYKGNVQAPAPIIWVDEDTDAEVKLTNIGLVIRPDL